MHIGDITRRYVQEMRMLKLKQEVSTKLSQLWKINRHGKRTKKLRSDDSVFEGIEIANWEIQRN